jgi:hypothetical protein
MSPYSTLLEGQAENYGNSENFALCICCRGCSGPQSLAIKEGIHHSLLTVYLLALIVPGEVKVDLAKLNVKFLTKFLHKI